MNKSEQKEFLSKYSKNYSTYNNFAVELKGIFEKILTMNAVHVAHIEARAKTIESLQGKLDKKGKKYNSPSEITDLVGVRIVVYSLDDIDVTEKIIRREFSVDEVNSIDKGKELSVKEFGYLSKHFIISLNQEREHLTEYSKYVGLKAEVQVRTILQHAWAAIEHKLKYKSNIELPDEQKRELNSIAASLESNDKSFKRILDVYNEIYEQKLNNESK